MNEKAGHTTHHTYKSKGVPVNTMLFWGARRYIYLYVMILNNVNISMQYTAIFQGCKNDNFRLKLFDFLAHLSQRLVGELIQGVPEKNETHFQFLITLKLFNPYKAFYTSF